MEKRKNIYIEKESPKVAARVYVNSLEIKLFI